MAEAFDACNAYRFPSFSTSCKAAGRGSVTLTREKQKIDVNILALKSPRRRNLQHFEDHRMECFWKPATCRFLCGLNTRQCDEQQAPSRQDTVGIRSRWTSVQSTTAKFLQSQLAVALQQSEYLMKSYQSRRLGCSRNSSHYICLAMRFSHKDQSRPWWFESREGQSM